ncbi:hypothetical protein D3C72_2514660 [compost metagenome]
MGQHQHLVGAGFGGDDGDEASRVEAGGEGGAFFKLLVGEGRWVGKCQGHVRVLAP